MSFVLFSKFILFFICDLVLVHKKEHKARTPIFFPSKEPAAQRGGSEPEAVDHPMAAERWAQGTVGLGIQDFHELTGSSRAR